MKIAIDFDGTIHRFSKGWHDGSIYDPPVEGCRETLKELKRLGHEIILYTCRLNPGPFEGDTRTTEERREALYEWLNRHGFSLIVNELWTFEGKPYADLYIDDKAITFTGNWAKTLETIKNFRPWIGVPPKLYLRKISINSSQTSDTLFELWSDRHIPGFTTAATGLCIASHINIPSSRALAKSLGAELDENPT